MDPVTTANQAVILLRQRLLERARTVSTKAKTSDTSTIYATDRDHAVPTQSLLQQDGMDERLLGKLLIESLLSNEFGAQLVNDAQFQQVVEKVMTALETDPATADMLQKSLNAVRAPQR